ncbi:MAG: hypothetical protein E6G93_19860 [Alphaproteobacteria bacterium]|nr:MAG: hypothetical protein E6G93_19860 [Alphaproteobacteria bacterium]
MIRSALLLCAAGLAAVTFACVAPPVAPPAPPPPPIHARIAAACTFDASQVVVTLTPGFDAAAYGNCKPTGCSASPPTPDTSAPGLNQTLIDTIQQVFDHSSQNFQSEMCQLDHIYIDTDQNSVNTAPWGIRERARNGRRHIGIPLRTLTVFSDYSSLENSILNTLLNTTWSDTIAAVPNTPEMMIAAILAHEIGHIVWWALPIPPGICQNNDDFFITWRSVIRSPAHGFHNFGGEQPGNMPIERFKFSNVKYDVNNNNLNRLSTVYSDGNWPSLFGFVAPDEDFIETYKLVTLTSRDPQSSSQLTHLYVTIPNNTASIDMVSVLNDPNTNLYAKAQWINTCVGTP